MISFFRHHLQGRFLRYIVYFISFFVVFPYSFNTLLDWFNVGTMQNWVVSVNGYTAGFAEFQNREQEITHQVEYFKSMFGDKAAQFLAMQGLDQDPKILATNGLILQKLLDSVAHKLSLYVAPSYAQFYLLKGLPKQYFLPDGKIDTERLQQTTHKTLAQLEREQQQRIKEELVTQLTSGALYLPLFVLKDYYVREYSAHTFLIASFSRAKFLESEKKQLPSQQDLLDFFAAQNRKSKRYLVPERRSGVAWTFDPATYGVTVTDNQIKKYYERKKLTDYVATPAQIQVRHILLSFTDKDKADVRMKINQLYQELLKDPVQFEKKVREFSQDNASREKGGLLNYFSRGTHEQPFEQAAFRLTTDGAISPVIETSKGFHILQRVGRKSVVFKPLDSVRDSIIKTLRLEQFKTSFPHMVRQVTAQHEDKEQALSTFAGQRGAKKQVFTDVVLSDAPVIQKLFATRKDGVSSLIDGEHGLVVITTVIHKAYEPAFEQVKSRVTDDWYQEKAARAIKKVLREADAFTTIEQFKQFAHQHGVAIEQTGQLVAHNAEQVKKLKDKMGDGFERLFAMSVPGSVAVQLGEQVGYAVCLSAIEPFNEQDFQTHLSELAAPAVREQQSLVARGFIASLCKTATIKVNEKLVL